MPGARTPEQTIATTATRMDIDRSPTHRNTRRKESHRRMETGNMMIYSRNIHIKSICICVTAVEIEKHYICLKT